MKYVGVDLHKQTITLCVVDAARKPFQRARVSNLQSDVIVKFLAALGEFELVVEATASYEWFVRLVEPLACRVVLAHPGKLRVIAESTRKSDKLDARILAEMLAQQLILPAYRPTPRQRGHRRLVRQRAYLQRRLTSVRNKLRHILADENLDRQDLFTLSGLNWLRTTTLLPPEDRFVVDLLLEEWTHHLRQRRRVEQQIRAFAAASSPQEQEDRRRLRTIPGLGEVTAEVLLAELAGPRRFTSAKQVVSYAGLAPGQRESAGKRKNLSIEKTGSPLLRWVLVQAAWQLARRSLHWNRIYARLELRVGRKKAVVALARRLLCLAHTLLRKAEDYHEPARTPAADPASPQRPPRRAREAKM